MLPHRRDSWMFHYPNIGLVKYFAEAAELPLLTRETSGEKEREVQDLKHLLEPLEVEGVVNGAVASTYQKTRIEKICKQLDMQAISPLWQEEEYEILTEIITQNFTVVITSVSAYGFTKEWLGRKINKQTVEDLKRLNTQHGISLVGEGGEYETTVLDAPYFKHKITILNTKKHWKNETGYLQITKAELKPKKNP